MGGLVLRVSSLRPGLLCSCFVRGCVPYCDDFCEEAAQSGGFAAGSVFRQVAIRVFHHIENEVKRIAGNDKNVYEYGLAVRGYRADEYQAAMEAVGEYL